MFFSDFGYVDFWHVYLHHSFRRWCFFVILTHFIWMMVSFSYYSHIFMFYLFSHMYVLVILICSSGTKKKNLHLYLSQTYIISCFREEGIVIGSAAHHESENMVEQWWKEKMRLNKTQTTTYLKGYHFSFPLSTFIDFILFTAGKPNVIWMYWRLRKYDVRQ